MFCLFKPFISETRKYVSHISAYSTTDICRFEVKRNVHSRDAPSWIASREYSLEKYRRYPSRRSRLRRKSRTSDLVNSRTRRCRRGLNSAVREWNRRLRIEPLIRGRLVAQSACIPTTFFRLYDLGLTLDPTLSLQWQWQMRKQWQAELLSYHATWNRRSWGTSCT